MNYQEHGGDADRAAQLSGVSDMLDLSTGISPVAYPATDITTSVWHQLPSETDMESCLRAARQFYLVPGVLAVMAGAGTQSLLQLLPHLCGPCGEVWMSVPGYNEHGPAWQRAGHTVSHADTLPPTAQHAVMVMPNNPTGAYDLDMLQVVAEGVHKRDGWLVVDGAFARPDDVAQMTALKDYDRVLHLRSFGKFFGLAGLRLGFAIGKPDIIKRLRIEAGPWAVNTAALQIAAQALGDVEWQSRHLQFLDRQSKKLAKILTDFGHVIYGGTILFQTIICPDALALHSHLARHKIWTRHFTRWPQLLRFGLPADDDAFRQLAISLQNWRRQTKP